jgi:hypothetical protein
MLIMSFIMTTVISSVLRKCRGADYNRAEHRNE